MMIHNENKAGKRNGDGRNTENFEKARRRRPFKNAARYGWAHFQFALSPYLPHQRRTKTLPVAHVPKEFSMSIIYETFYVHPREKTVSRFALQENKTLSNPRVHTGGDLLGFGVEK